MQKVTTTDLSDFGLRELEKLQDIIEAMYEYGLPDDFFDDEVVPMFNTYSGNVFLTNSQYQVAMLNGNRLESYYYLAYDGNEGFIEELIEQYDEGRICEEDYEELAYLCEQNGFDEKAEEINRRMEEIL